MQILLILCISVLVVCQNDQALSKQSPQSIQLLHAKLKQIDRSLWSLSTSQYFNPILQRKSTIKLPKLQQHEFQYPLEVLETSKMPSRKQASFPVLLRLGNHLYSIAGEQLLRLESYYNNQSAPSYLISAARNDHLCVAYMYPDESITVVMEAEVKQKSCFLKPLINISHTFEDAQEAFTSFALGTYKTKRTYLFGSNHGNLYNFRKNGSLESITQISDSSITSLNKIGSNIFYLTQTEMGIIQASNSEKPTIAQCQLPQETIQKILPDDSGQGRFYVKTENNIVVYQYSPCKPVRILPIPSNSTAHILGNLILVHNQYVDSYFNTSHPNYERSLLSLTKQNLRDPESNRNQKSQAQSQKYTEVTTYKKSESTHVLMVRTFDKESGRPRQQVHVYYYMTEDESSSFNFKGLKAPIFVISIAIVFYYSYKVRNKNNSGSATSGEKPVREEEAQEMRKTATLLKMIEKNEQEKGKQVDPKAKPEDTTQAKKEPTPLERQIIEKIRQLEAAKKEREKAKQTHKEHRE